jgi:CheY-like chemotaxis protein
VSPHQDSRIFVVDEEHIRASTLAAILQKSGFSARFFTCPREALAAARLSSRPAHIRCDDAKPSRHRSCDPTEGAIPKVQGIAIVGTGMQPLTCSRPVMRADATSTCY